MRMNKCRICMLSTVQTSFWGSGREQYRNYYVPEMKKLAEELAFDLTAFEEIVTDEEEARRAAARVSEGNFDFLLVQVSTFAAGALIIPLEQTGVRLGLWGVPEITSKGAIPNNSFCGINMYGSIIHQYLDRGRHYKWFYGDVADPLFYRRLKVTVAALSAIRNLKGARVGLLGGIAPGFHDLYYDERQTRQKLGVTVDAGVEFQDIYKIAMGFGDREVAGVMEEMQGECHCMAKGLSRDCLGNTARVYMAMERIMEERGYDAIAISCWPRYRAELGIVVCSVIGRLLEKGHVAACEGDVDSAISMMILGQLAGRQPMLMDMSKFDRESGSVLMWHCGSAPHSYADEAGVCLDGHYKPGSRVTGMDDIRVPSVHNMYYGRQEVTVARFTNNYQNMLSFTGEFQKREDRSYDGSRGWLGGLKSDGQPVCVENLVNTVLVEGFQHHYPIVARNVETELLELMAWLDIQPLPWREYRDYLQNATI